MLEKPALSSTWVVYKDLSKIKKKYTLQLLEVVFKLLEQNLILKGDFPGFQSVLNAVHPTESEAREGCSGLGGEDFLFQASLLTRRKRQYESFASVFYFC